MDLRKILKELRAKLSKQDKEMKALLEKADSEKRDMTEDEDKRYAEIQAEYDKTEVEEKRIEKAIEREERASKRTTDPIKPDPNDPENRSAVQGEDQPLYRGNVALGEQMRDVVRVSHPAVTGEERNRAMSRLEQAANREIQIRAAGDGQIEGVGSEGGFLLQGETSIELITRGFNNSEVLKRCSSRTLTTASSTEIIGIDESSRRDGYRHGGVRVYTTAELEAMTESKTKFKRIKIEPKKLTGLYYASDEIIEDAPFLQQEMSELFGKEFAFKTQDLVIRGSGAGEPLGILNADCKVQVSKESGQTAATIVFKNILKMWSRCSGMN